MRELLARPPFWSAVREIMRVATPETEEAWIEKSERMTVRQLEAMVAGRRPGDLPTDAKDPLLVPRRVVFELLPEDFALVMEAFERVRKEIGPAATTWPPCVRWRRPSSEDGSRPGRLSDFAHGLCGVRADLAAGGR